MASDFLKAKELFDYYGGSKYQMARDEMLYEYLDYGISKEIESDWLEELFQKKYNDLKADNCRSFINMSVFIQMHPKLLVDKIIMLEDVVRTNIGNIICRNEVMILLSSILEQLRKENNFEYNHIILRLEKLV
ncbi:hypothetical protein ACFFUE_10795 [Bergeyella porcorum]|uniref:hypothetical protein n=1 Tax=Bergeyella porcorum TaxID=1735111 RepID=UPI0035EF9A13